MWCFLEETLFLELVVRFKLSSEHRNGVSESVLLLGCVAGTIFILVCELIMDVLVVLSTCVNCDSGFDL